MKRLQKFILLLLCVDLVAVVAAGILWAAVWQRQSVEQPESGAVSAVPEEEASQEVDPLPEGDTSATQSAHVQETVEPVTMVFAGDVLLDSRTAPNYDAAGAAGLLDETMLQLLTQADLTVVNQEFPFSTRGTPAEDKQYTFRVDPSYCAALQDMGVDLVTLANNHSLDYGKEALEDTFQTLDAAGIRYAGAGDSEERASALQTFEVGGRTFGFLAASRVIPVTGWNVANEQPGVFCTYDDAALVEQIQEAQERCDFLTVYVHWGKEHTTELTEHQLDLAKAYRAAGADLVIGSHPHVLQGISYQDGVPVFYSLGNFIFGSSIEETAALAVTVDEEGTVSYRLVGAYSENGKTCAMGAEEAQGLYAALDDLSQGVTVEGNGVVHLDGM